MSASTDTRLLLRARGALAGSTVTRMQVRDLAPFFVDGPAELGGTGQGPQPLEYVLSALNGSVAAMLSAIAAKQRFAYEAVELEAEGLVDRRGAAGVPGVCKHFQLVRQVVRLRTAEPPERVAQLQAFVEARCPVLSLLADAGVELETDWVTM